MNDTQPAPQTRHQELRQRFLAHAAAAFDLMFDPQYQDQLVTFDQREERACELGRDLTLWLLQRHTNADPQARPAEQPPRPARSVIGPASGSRLPTIPCPNGGSPP